MYGLITQFSSVFLLLDIFITVQGWPCVSPIKTVYSQINIEAVLQFSVDLTNLNTQRKFYVKFHDGSTKASIQYNANRSYTTYVQAGVTITGDSAGNVVVTLQNVQKRNAGIYMIGRDGIKFRCNCLYILGTPKKSTIKLNKTPSIGDRATLSCSSTSATTPSNHSLSFTYNWRMDNVDNPSGSRYSYSSNRNTLTLSNIVKDDVDKEFTCTATEVVTDGYTSSRSDLFIFGVHFKGLSCVSPVRTFYSRMGTNVTLQFSADLTNIDSPRQFFVKFCDGTIRAIIRYNADRSYTTDAITGVSIIGDTAGNVNVTLENVQHINAGIYSIDSAGIPLRCIGLYIFGFPSKPTITLSNVSSVGENATLTCSSTFTTTPTNHSLNVTYSWQVDNEDNPNGSRYLYSTNRSILTLSNIVKDDAIKQFTCTAKAVDTDGYTSSKSDIFSLDVYYGPEDLDFVPSNTTYDMAENTKLDPVTCTAICNPHCSFKWTKIGQTAIVNDTAVLNLGTLVSSDTGTYRCTAWRSGSFSQTRNLTVNVNSLATVSTKSSKNDNECITLMITSVTFGIICAVVTMYATGITILYKRQMKRKGTKYPNKSSTQTTYVNSTYLSDALKEQERIQRREHIDNATGIDEDRLKQYTDLTRYSKDENTTYDVLQ